MGAGTRWSATTRESQWWYPQVKSHVNFLVTVMLAPEDQGQRGAAGVVTLCGFSLRTLKVIVHSGLYCKLRRPRKKHSQNWPRALDLASQKLNRMSRVRFLAEKSGSGFGFYRGQPLSLHPQLLLGLQGAILLPID
ncbi:hypothetical protein RRG08_011634 [Elysia crispata]|uniref:Uncharacterized protein n=1 Tax=Elysia crispata TaxID=231223 RepID=A0AAE0YW88_9GAST|nr:hypothetical protein RRG08_011634 [Elysia crispata]